MSKYIRYDTPSVLHQCERFPGGTVYSLTCFILAVIFVLILATYSKYHEEF